MSPLGTLICNAGIAEGISQAATENARNLFNNGTSFELVRDFIVLMLNNLFRDFVDYINL